MTSASCSARSALMVSKSGSPGPAPTSVTLPCARPDTNAPDKAGEIANTSGQHRFDALPQAARHDRRSSAGADSDDHITAIDDGRKNEGRMREIVHHIHRQTDGLCPRRHKRPDVASARTQNCDHSGKIGSQWIASGKLNSRSAGGLEAV